MFTLKKEASGCAPLPFFNSGSYWTKVHQSY